MLKILEKIGSKRSIHKITRSANQYPNYKTSNGIKRIYNYKGSVVTFDDMLGARNSSRIDEIYTRSRHENLSIYYISQSCFGLTRQTIRNNSDIIILFNQTLRVVQCMDLDIEAYDMLFSEYKKKCHKVWSEKFLYLCIDTTKNKMKANIVLSVKAKTHILTVIVKLKIFSN